MPPLLNDVARSVSRAAALVGVLVACAGAAETRPNVLIAISDDQSWPHASAYGSEMVETPNFDRVADAGALWGNAFCASPGCSPSRAALLTGLNTWQLEHAGTHASFFHPKYETFPDRLGAAGYHVGYTGKGWGPGDALHLGREHNPAGPRFREDTPPGEAPDYAAAFERFLAARPADRPFCFWFGSNDPHRGFTPGSGLASGKRLGDAEVPAFLPDAEPVREDLLDYAHEIERFDEDLGKLLAVLEVSGLSGDTLILVTSDNGMPFPRAKANCYEYGIHVPLAIRWDNEIPPGQRRAELIGFTDLTATIYDAAGVSPGGDRLPAGQSVLPALRSGTEFERDAVFAARERHSSSRYRTLGFPQRAVRTREYLYVRNFTPERWPAGAPRKYAEADFNDAGDPLRTRLGPPHGGYHDIDAGPTRDYLIEHLSDESVRRFFDLAVGHRPAEELYDIRRDPGCLNNLAADPQHAGVRRRLSVRLGEYLKATGDPRAEGHGEIWENYPRVSAIRTFPPPRWVNESPESAPEVPWLNARRSREYRARGGTPP